MLRVDALPGELVTLRQWVMWRREERAGKVTKVPYQPNGKRASSTDPGTWSPFSVALSHLDQFDGIGFVFSPSDPFLGVDLDHARDAASGLIAPEATDVIDRLDSYTEVSQSGEGLHVIIRARKPGERSRKGLFEAYSEGRFFVMTGDHVPETPCAINERQAEVDAIYAEVFPPLAPARAPGTVTLADDELLRRMFASRAGADIARLWGGDIGSYSSQSEADLALISHLMFWVNGDVERADALFRASALMREKWDERRGAQTYGEATLGRAAATMREGYEPRRMPSAAWRVLPL